MLTQSPDRSLDDLRVPSFAGALNFRDMGGYKTFDGRTVQWQRLYRSGTTHLMTGEDLAHLVSRGIRHAYDLRSNSERRRHPSRLNGIAGVTYGYFDHDRLPGDVARLIKQPDARPEQSRQLMLSAYRDMPFDFREAYREIFALLADGRLPLVINCTVGKDRTGVAAALVLTALGVPRETIHADYRLTERWYERSCALLAEPGGINPFGDIDNRIWEPMMQADVVYLDAMFDQLARTHGSPETYLSEELGVDYQAIQKIRAHLLENAT